MTVKYEYKSASCGHEYIEQRGASEPMFFPTCAKCGLADYELVGETEISPTLEVSAAPVIPEVDPAIALKQVADLAAVITKAENLGLTPSDIEVLRA